MKNSLILFRFWIPAKNNSAGIQSSWFYHLYIVVSKTRNKNDVMRYINYSLIYRYCFCFHLITTATTS